MAHCERKTTVATILLLAVVAAATVSPSRAWPIRITRDATESPVNIADVQRNLKGYVNSLFFVTKDFPLDNACRLWKDVTTALKLQGQRNSTGSNSTVTEANLRSITCHKISEEITGYDLILEDGTCSELTLDYLCDRELQNAESYNLFDLIDVEVDFREWVRENFDESMANHIIDLYDRK